MKRSELRIDWSDYDTIRDAVLQAPEEYRPHQWWIDRESRTVPRLKNGSQSIFEETWVGLGSEHEVPYVDSERYLAELRESDELNLLRKYPRYRSRQFLDAVSEINLLFKHCGLRDGCVVLDLGGGYGRLAEFLLPEFKVSYVVVEALALSLLIAPQYISHVLDIPVNHYWGQRDAEFKSACSVWPSWRIMDVLPRADIIVNIHAMQEMGDTKCSFYFDLLERHKRESAFVFLKNRDGMITTNWRFPSSWRLVHEAKRLPGDSASDALGNRKLRHDGMPALQPTWLRIFR